MSGSPTGVTPQKSKPRQSNSPNSANWAEEVDAEEKETVKTNIEMTDEQGKTVAKKTLSMEDLGEMIKGLATGLNEMKGEMKKELEEVKVSQSKMFDEMTKRMGGLETHAGKQDEEMAEMKKWRKGVEERERRETIRRAKRGLIVFGLKEVEGGRERVMTTIKKLKDDMKVEDDCLIGAEAWRLRRNKGKNDGKPRPVMIRFPNFAQKMEFLAGAKNVAKDSKLIFKHDVPVNMMDEVNKLEKNCATIRKDTKGQTKTRLRWKDDKLVAQIKKEGEENFKDVDMSDAMEH